jgi:hypothetical protein
MEWRLGGLDLLTTKDDAAGVLWGLGGVAPGDIGERSAPEIKKGGWQVLREYVDLPRTSLIEVPTQLCPTSTFSPCCCSRSTILNPHYQTYHHNRLQV